MGNLVAFLSVQLVHSFGGSGTDPILLLVFLLLFFFLLGQYSSKNLRYHHFRSDRDEMWHDFSSSKYASIDGIKQLTMCYKEDC